MNSARVCAFFSCSFNEADKEVNNLFSTIARSLDMELVNVSGASVRVPPAEAKKLIKEAQVLLGVAVRRKELPDGKHLMPQAVSDEIAMAFGCDTPIALFIESGVSVEGFLPTYCTYLSFERDKLFDIDTIGKIVSSIHKAKMDVLNHRDFMLEQDIQEFFTESLMYHFELCESDGSYYWAYDSTKKIIFKETAKKSFTTGVWPAVPSKIPEGAKNMEFNLSIDSASDEFKMDLSGIKSTPDSYETSVKFIPSPKKGDCITYSMHCKSRYLNPIYLSDIHIGQKLELDGNCYLVYDGMVPITPTKNAIVIFRFPKSYGLEIKNIRPFVGSYTKSIDYYVESELERCIITKEQIGEQLIIRMSIESPLLRHMYGLAWNPKN